jgi:hypothetical protein
LFLLLDLTILILLFQIGASPLFCFCKCGMWRIYPNLSSLGQTWKVKFFMFNFLFWVFLIIHVFGKRWLIMCFFFVQEYFDIMRLIIFYSLHFICTIALCIFWAHYILFFFQLLVNV